MEPADLVAAAKRLLADADAGIGATSLLAAALLLRQAVEEVIGAVWDERLPAMRDVSGRAQHITLPYFVDAETAKALTYAWNRLSELCHHGAGPSNWLSAVELRALVALAKQATDQPVAGRAL
ncbi:MAG: hypothetical protein AB7W59_29545 [Acidimicrobiia bacterium]